MELTSIIDKYPSSPHADKIFGWKLEYFNLNIGEFKNTVLLHFKLSKNESSLSFLKDNLYFSSSILNKINKIKKYLNKFIEIYTY